MNNLLKLINILGKNLKNEITIRQLSKIASIPYTSTYRTITNNKELFTINPKANIKLISLNLKDPVVKHYLIISERETTNAFLKEKKMFSILRRDFPQGDYTLILFGSRADGKEREKSDIDLCIVNKDGKKNIEFSSFKTLFDLKIDALFFSKKEFLIMLKEKDYNLGNEIMKKHIILYGDEYFWNLIWEAKNEI